ncbi:MAG: hypothetical protein ACRD29_22840, partial [Acidimicrobiales bacterium]
MEGVMARKALDRLIEAARSGRLEEVCDRLGVRVLGAFGSATRSGAAADDLDVAVGFVGAARELELLDALIELTGYDTIDLLVVDRA